MSRFPISACALSLSPKSVRPPDALCVQRRSRCCQIQFESAAPKRGALDDQEARANPNGPIPDAFGMTPLGLSTCTPAQRDPSNVLGPSGAANRTSRASRLSGAKTVADAGHGAY